jgi:hypothetical protein
MTTIRIILSVLGKIWVAGLLPSVLFLAVLYCYLRATGNKLTLTRQIQNGELVPVSNWITALKIIQMIVFWPIAIPLSIKNTIVKDDEDDD